MNSENQILLLLGELKGQMSSIENMIRSQGDRMDRQDERMDRQDDRFTAIEVRITDLRKDSFKAIGESNAQLASVKTKVAIIFSIASAAVIAVQLALRFLPIFG